MVLVVGVVRRTRAPCTIRWNISPSGFLAGCRRLEYRTAMLEGKRSHIFRIQDVYAPRRIHPQPSTGCCESARFFARQTSHGKVMIMCAYIEDAAIALQQLFTNTIIYPVRELLRRHALLPSPWQ